MAYIQESDDNGTRFGDLEPGDLFRATESGVSGESVWIKTDGGTYNAVDLADGGEGTIEDNDLVIRVSRVILASD